MRAVYLKDIQQEHIEIDGEKLHHFKNVLRLKLGTEILCLNGSGSDREYTIDSISKKSMSLKAISPINKHVRAHDLSLAIACVKKDALDLSLKMACELGFKKITILESEFSQKYKLNLQRMESILISALEQSNSPYLPELKVEGLDIFLENNKKIFYLSMKKEKSPSVDNFKNYTLLIGPEAGFSESEHELICQNIETVPLHLNTNILRAQTAVATGCGFVLSMQNNIDA